MHHNIDILIVIFRTTYHELDVQVKNQEDKKNIYLTYLKAKIKEKNDPHALFLRAS